MTAEPEVFEVLRKIRYDLTAAQAKVTDALTMLAAMNLPTPDEGEWKCPHCKRTFRTERSLALHDANIHDGPPVPMSEVEAQA